MDEPLTPEGIMDSWKNLSAQAAQDTHQRFGQRLLGIPGTWIGLPYSRQHRLRDGSMLSDINGISHPLREWNYWWQAHYLDAIIDDGLRYLGDGQREQAKRELRRANELLRGIRFRNFGVYPNYFFDDMAWLALASQRLVSFSRQLEGRSAPQAKQAILTLRKQLAGAIDDVLDGGMYWSRKRDFKNAPANAPAALFFARNGERELSRGLLSWLRLKLFNTERGLYVDGLRLIATGRKVEEAVYTYNQGPVLGALLELGTDEDLEHASILIHASQRFLTDSSGALAMNGGGDGNLFAGILSRYLALAANDIRLDDSTRAVASKMIVDTARSIVDQEPRRLSAAVQRWMIFNSAGACSEGASTE
ncbi:glycoside hydrolase family 76 protein [Glutamicibacter sp. JC586]|uniref:glycoside hydrolase family 76 protein n=1 Tax=Glutamicibacter sp. JC586 TaxID=2590552 RepID=UPI00135C322A|nr:glycoside hydrolase family 76 protein [Glutamicibacter sp. JC586]